MITMEMKYLSYVIQFEQYILDRKREEGKNDNKFGIIIKLER